MDMKSRCPIVDIVEGNRPQILPVGIFQKLSPEFIGIDLPDGVGSGSITR